MIQVRNDNGLNWAHYTWTGKGSICREIKEVEPRGLYYSPRAVVPQTGWLKSLIRLSQFWKPEVQNQGVGRAMLTLKALGGESFLLLPIPVMADNIWRSLAYRCITPISAFVDTWYSSLRVSPCLCFLKTLWKCISHWIRAHPEPIGLHLNLSNYTCHDLISK